MANVYTTVGKALIVDRIDDTAAGNNTDYIGWGTGAGISAVGDTTLFTESGDESRSSATKSQPAADKNQWQATITCATSGKTITNMGVLTASSGGTLILKGDFTGIPLAVGDAIQATFTLQQT